MLIKLLIWLSIFSPFHKPVVTIERVTSHRVVFQKDGNVEDMCTATVIGPHAFITAEHCDPKHDFTEVTFDLSREEFPILAFYSDGHDHLLLLVSGQGFEDIEPYAVARAFPGDEVKFFGFGGDDYPAHLRSGQVVEFDDYSEIDKRSGILEFSAEAIPGDSGAAIYNDRNQIVALVSYREGTAGFPLAFPIDIIRAAQKF